MKAVPMKYHGGWTVEAYPRFYQLWPPDPTKDDEVLKPYTKAECRLRQQWCSEVWYGNGKHFSEFQRGATLNEVLKPFPKAVQAAFREVAGKVDA